MTKVEIGHQMLKYISERVRMKQLNQLEEHICFRGFLDGASTIEDALERLYDFADQLERLQGKGYELQQPFENDHAHVKRLKSLPKKEESK
jgi:hypothetical protein